MSNELKIKLRDYNHVNEVATFTYVTESGRIDYISIHKHTFAALVTKGAWNEAKYGNQSTQQREFIGALKHEVKGDLVSWYEEVTNEFMKMKVSQNKK